MILTRQNLSDDQNARDCAAQYRKATDTTGPSRPFKLAEWALEWGEAMLEHLDDGADDESDALDDMSRKLSDAEMAHKAHLREISDAVADLLIAARDVEKAVEQ